MYKTWDTSALQSRKNHQKPPGGSQRQRFHHSKSEVIYRYKCDRVECDEEYIGESARTFGKRLKEHLQAPSPVYKHSNITCHYTTVDNVSIVRREDQNLARTMKVKESIYISVNGPSLNRYIDKCHLQHIWYEAQINTPELKLNKLLLQRQWPFQLPSLHITSDKIHQQLMIPSAIVSHVVIPSATQASHL